MSVTAEERTIARDSSEEQSIVHEARGALAAALERIGCQTEANPHAVPGNDGLELPSVTFRASGALLAEILELVSELANRPPSRARLCHDWCVESRPSRQGGVLHTLTPRRHPAWASPTEIDLQSARRDSETLAAFFLLRRGQAGEQAAHAPRRRPTRMPAVRPAEGRTRGYFRGTLSIVPSIAAGR
jgi:hypothetical protein